jgi:pyrroline-5-carboxylate reductase
MGGHKHDSLTKKRVHVNINKNQLVQFDKEEIMVKLNGTLGFIGAGNMAEAMICAIVSANIMPVSQITVCDIDPSKLQTMKTKFAVSTCNDPALLFATSDTVILAVKPQVMDTVLEGLIASPHFNLKKKKLLMSIAAGIPITRMEKLLYKNLDESEKKNLPVIRVMPNTPSLVLAGMSGYCLNSTADARDGETAETILSSMGKTLRCSETLMDAVTAVSGSGPAYFFFVVESMVEAGVKLGLSRDEALLLSVQTMKGAAALLEQSGDDPEVLRKKVTSPGGTTEAAIRVFTERGMKDIIHNALDAAANRAKELST